MAALLATAASLPATTIEPPDFSALVSEAEAVVRARVVSQHSYFVDEPGQRLIETLVELDVARTEKGAPAQHLSLRLLGGQVGEEVLQVDAMPQLQVGQDVILFITGNGRNVCPLAGWGHGLYRVYRDSSSGREWVARANGTPLASLGQVADSLEHDAARALTAEEAMSPDALLRAVRAELERQQRAR